jgi:hypothetical protein
LAFGEAVACASAGLVLVLDGVEVGGESGWFAACVGSVVHPLVGVAASRRAEESTKGVSMNKKCKRCGACQECGQVPYVVYPQVPYPWTYPVYPYPQTGTPLISPQTTWRINQTGGTFSNGTTSWNA